MLSVATLSLLLLSLLLPTGPSDFTKSLGPSGLVVVDDVVVVGVVNGGGVTVVAGCC